MYFKQMFEICSFMAFPNFRRQVEWCKSSLFKCLCVSSTSSRNTDNHESITCEEEKEATCYQTISFESAITRNKNVLLYRTWSKSQVSKIQCILSLCVSKAYVFILRVKLSRTTIKGKYEQP